MTGADPRSASISLNGLKVLVTRPAEQSVSLVNAINESGGSASCFPLLEIEPISPCPDELEHLDNYSLIIFVSRNAVEYSWPCLSKPLPAVVKVAAIGSGTANCLQQHDQVVEFMPAEQFDSEGLLALPALKDVAGQRILIVRGQGGRETLAETLRKRGAIVSYAEVYRRLATKQALTYEAGDIDVIIVTSSEALAHLAQIAKQADKSWILNKPLLVIHERIAMRAGELGFKLKPGVAKQASEASMLEALHLINKR